MTTGSKVRAALHARRMELQLSQIQAAFLCGVAEATYNRWERGHRLPQAKLHLVAEYLGLSPGEMEALLAQG